MFVCRIKRLPYLITDSTLCQQLFSKFFHIISLATRLILSPIKTTVKHFFILCFYLFCISDRTYLTILLYYMSTIFIKKILNKKAVLILSNNTAKYSVNDRFITFFYYAIWSPTYQNHIVCQSLYLIFIMTY